MSNVLSRVLVYGFLLAGIGGFVANEVRMNQPAQWEDNKHIITGPNLPGGQAETGQTDVHVIYRGLNDNCYMETWILPFEYMTVNDFLKDHPEAQPDTEGFTGYSVHCKPNEYKERLPESRRDSAYYSEMTGSKRKLDMQDNWDQDKV